MLAGASNGGDQRCRWMNTFKKGPNGFRAFADALALPTFMTGLSYSVAMGDPAEDLEVKLTYTPSHLGKTGPSVTDTIAVVFLRGLIRCGCRCAPPRARALALARVSVCARICKG